MNTNQMFCPSNRVFLTVKAIGAVILLASFASAQIVRLPPPPPPHQAPGTVPSSARMSIEIDVGSEKFLLKPVGGTVYDVYRESDNRKIGSANVATGDLMPLGPDFQGNNTALQRAKEAYMQGKAHPYNSGGSTAAANPDAASPKPSSARPQVTFSSAGEAQVSVDDVQAFGGPATITISPDGRTYSAQVMNGSEVWSKVTATYKSDSAASRGAKRVGRTMLYGFTYGNRGSVQAPADAVFQVKSASSRGSQEMEVPPPGAGKSKVASREEMAKDSITGIAIMPMMVDFYKAKEAAMVAKTQKVAGADAFNPDPEAAALIDKFGASYREINGSNAVAK